jgi:transcriptional regulator with XRE-family HTH domain
MELKYIMNNILEKKANIWCSRLNNLMKENGYTQETFLKEYKRKYGGGTQANVSRWLRVGSRIQKDGKAKTIGFPSYENMLNIADFFGVTIGYLTGETDFETFEMEKACQFIGIDEDTGKAIKGIVSGESIRPFGKYESKECSAVIKYLFTAGSFPALVKGIREYAENIYSQKHPYDHVAMAQKGINKDILDLAFQCLDYQCLYDDEYGKTDDFKENNIEPTKELLEAIHTLNKAIEQSFDDEEASDQMVKLSEYELQKIYFDVLKDIVSEEHLPDMIIPCYSEDELIL